MLVAAPSFASPNRPAAAPAESYRPRRPQDTVLHRVVRDHFRTFLAHTERLYARPLPRYVVREFEKYLACGDPTRGFVRCVCATCGLERAVPFSCKTRGVCPSCAGRRMSDSAARLVDTVLPAVPLRQWVLSLPYDLRLLVAARADLLRDVVRVFFRTVFRYLRERLRRGNAAAGAVVAVHRGGGALNLNPHLHALVPDGLFLVRPGGDVGFHRVPAPSPADLRWVVDTVRRRVLRRLGRLGLLRDERLAGEGSNEPLDLAALEACSVVALRAGNLESLEEPDADPDDLPAGRRPDRWSARNDGFNVHAGVRVAATDHVGRERLARYITRPAFSMERFGELPDGRIAYQVRHPLGPDRTHRVMTPVELLARLAALVPPPRYPLLRYAGVFAPSSSWRPFVVPQPPQDPTPPRGRPCSQHPHRPDDPAAVPPPPGAVPKSDPAVRRESPADPQLRSLDDSPGSPDPLLGGPPPLPRTLSDEHWRRLDDGLLLARQPRVDWATLLRRTFLEDVLCCPRCRGRMALVETVTDEHDVRRRLAALGLPLEPAAFRSAHDPDDAPPVEPGACTRRTGRGPPPPEVDQAAGPSPFDDPEPGRGVDDPGEPPWSDDCRLPPEGPEPGRRADDDTSQLPPDADL